MKLNLAHALKIIQITLCSVKTTLYNWMNSYCREWHRFNPQWDGNFQPKHGISAHPARKEICLSTDL